jgi:hypothetical protein
MEARDFRNRIILEGSLVRYLGTLTTGMVEEVKIQKDLAWIKIDSTGLFYRSDYLEVFEAKSDVNKKSKAVKETKHKIPLSRSLKKIAATEISDHNDGPGYGGG